MKIGIFIDLARVGVNTFAPSESVPSTSRGERGHFVHLCGFGARVTVAAETEGRLWVRTHSR